MIIVYLSIVLFVTSLIYLEITSFKTFKDMKLDLERVQDATVRIQQNMDTIKLDMT
jgi:uncharacterized protein YoxC